MSVWQVTESSSGVTFSVRVVPRSSRNQIVGVESGALKVRLTAPPVEGAANTALIEFVAEWLGVKRSAVSIISGDKARNKLVRVNGETREQVEARFLRAS
ncbi:MAG: YggU family protein [Chloroflexi bacterium]|nr:YggU family protein [Chloroflexota bacterium]